MTAILPPTYLPGDPAPAFPGDDPATFRWSIRRKEELIIRLKRGEITLADALARFNLTVEEIDAWRAAYKVHGRRGLRLGVHRASVPRPQAVRA